MCYHLTAQQLHFLTYLPDWLIITVDGSEFAFVCSCKDLLVKYFGLLVFALLQVAAGEVVFRLSYVRIVGAQLVFIYFQSTLVVKLNLFIFTLKTLK